MLIIRTFDIVSSFADWHVLQKELGLLVPGITKDRRLSRKRAVVRYIYKRNIKHIIFQYSINHNYGVNIKVKYQARWNQI